VLSSRKALCALSLLSCALTLGASGDDFSFVRLALPAADAVADSLPEDDPNSDFAASADAGAGRRTYDSPGDDRGRAGTGRAAPTSSNHSAPLHASPPGGHLPRNELNTPLRC
jgi:hypothetical protein